MLAVALLSAASARIESITLTQVGSRPAVRVSVSGTPGTVVLGRERSAARLVITDAELGLRFSGARRVSWAPGGQTSPGWLSGSRGRWLRRIEVGEGAGLVYVVLLYPGAAAELRRDAQGVLIVLPRARDDARETSEAAGEDRPAAAVPAPPTEGGHGAAPPPIVGPEGPSARGEPQTEEPVPGDRDRSVAKLYPQLFPPPPNEESPRAPIALPVRDLGATLGPFRLTGSVETRYVDADTYLTAADQRVRDHYLELDPRAGLELPMGAGSLAVEYKPALRALATYGQMNSSSHYLNGTLDLPLGERLTVRADERFVLGTLDTRVVDPGGEYFFSLGRFRRNDVNGGVSVLISPRTSLELSGSASSVHFLRESSFFDYDSRRFTAGVGFEVTPNLKAVVAYAYDLVPRPSDHPQAEARAHSANLTLSGELLPLLSGELDLAYRNQRNPAAGAGGRRYAGLTFSGVLTRQLAPEASLSLYLSRGLPVSAYQANGFYVSTAAQAALQVPLPLALQVRFGVGHQWNDYRVAGEGGLREDRIFSWYATLRRALRGNLALSGSYRLEQRRSSLAAFDTDSSGLLLQLEWQALGRPAR